MKFIVDAQLPRRIARRLNEAGHDAIHTLDLPNGNRSTDLEVLQVAAQDGRVVITKDSDFVNSFFLKGEPDKLDLVSTGNISNVSLESLFIPNLPAIVSAFGTARFLELTRTTLIVHQ